MQQRPDDGDNGLDLWWPTPPRQLDPATQVRQLHEIMQRRRLAQREEERAFDLMLRGLARCSSTSAPATFTDSVRQSLTRASIAPSPPPSLARRPVVPQVVVTWWRLRPSLRLVNRHAFTERQRRAALGSAGTLAAALLVGSLGWAFAPSEILTVVGLVSALLFSTVALGHLFSAAVGAIMGSTLLAVGACAVYATLTIVWVRLIRRPVEA